jgi:branched-chain amino acid transport system substrate-binding protein
MSPISQAGEKTGITDKEILIGGIGPVTGPASNLGAAVQYAGFLATKQINEAGGIHGRKIKYIMADDVCASSQGLGAAKKLVYSDKVFAIHGLTCTHVGLAIRPILEKEGVPIVITVAQGDKLLIPHSKYLFRVLPPTNITGNLMGIFMNKYFSNKYTKVAILLTQEEYGTSGRDGLVSRLSKYGIKPLAIETHKIGDTDYSSQILKIKAVDPEVFFILSYVKDMGVIIKQSHELGLNCVKIGYLGSDFPLIAEMGGPEAVKDFYGPTSVLDAIHSDTIKSFVDMYKKEYPDYMKNPFNPTSSDIGSYVAMQVMAEALKRAGRDLTRTKYIAALESMKGFKTPWYPPITFSATDHEGCKEEVFLRYVNGEAKKIDMEIKMED